VAHCSRSFAFPSNNCLIVKTPEDQREFEANVENEYLLGQARAAVGLVGAVGQRWGRRRARPGATGASAQILAVEHGLSQRVEKKLVGWSHTQSRLSILAMLGCPGK